MRSLTILSQILNSGPSFKFSLVRSSLVMRWRTSCRLRSSSANFRMDGSSISNSFSHCRSFASTFLAELKKVLKNKLLVQFWRSLIEGLAQKLFQWCRNRGEGAGGPLAPIPIFGRSVQPISTWGGQIIPTYYYWPPNFFHLPASLSYVFRNCTHVI